MNIQAIKIGNTVNISMNGKLYKKVCNSPADAVELFQFAMKAKTDPTPENIKAVKALMNEKLRIALYAGLETDTDTGEIYLAGFNTPIPETLVNVIKEYHENEYPMHPIINFWKLLMINPDKRVRESLFKFITTHDFVLTDNGYMIVYKAVYVKENKTTDAYTQFLKDKYEHVKKVWKTNPDRYVVYRDVDDNNYSITKFTTAADWNEEEKGIKIIGKLGELYDAVVSDVESQQTEVYTDMYTQTMTIELGKPVKMNRDSCDGDPTNDCSFGLHVGATRYVEGFAGSKSKILICFVNPANVVAVPDYDHSKMRVSEYFPFALAEFKDHKINIIEETYYESDYQNYEAQELEALIEKVKNEELPINAAKNSDVEERSMSELMKILESRMIDIS